MIVASPCVPNCACSEERPRLLRVRDSWFDGKAETNAKDVMTYSTPSPVTLR